MIEFDERELLISRLERLDCGYCVLRHGASTGTIRLKLYLSTPSISTSRKKLKDTLEYMVSSGRYSRRSHFNGGYRYIKND